MGSTLSQVGSRWDWGGFNDFSSHSIHKAKEVGPQSTKGVISRHAKGLVLEMQGDGFASEPGGIMEVAMWLCEPLLLGL